MMIVFIFAQASITFMLHMIFLTYSGLPGGEIGMFPLLTLLGLTVQVAVSLVVYWAFFRKRKMSLLTSMLFLLLNNILFELSVYLIGDKCFIIEALRSQVLGRMVSLPYLWSTFILMLFCFIRACFSSSERASPDRKP